jgi:hypothetical protein
LTWVLLDTCTYLRLAKRIRPLVGRKFGLKNYVITILKDVEDEVLRNQMLQYMNPWFSDKDLQEERLAKRVNLSPEEKKKIAVAQSIFRDYVLENAIAFSKNKRSPPSLVDCGLLAFCQVREAIVATDDLGMHQLAKEFGLQVWHGYQLLDKLRSAKEVNHALIEEIYAALDANGDLTATWRDAKYTVFAKVFGKVPN